MNLERSISYRHLFGAIVLAASIFVTPLLAEAQITLEIGDQAFAPGGTELVDCSLTNAGLSDVSVDWVVSGHMPNFAPAVTAGTINVPAGQTVDIPLSVTCTAAGDRTVTFASTNLNPSVSDGGDWACSALPPCDCYFDEDCEDHTGDAEPGGPGVPGKPFCQWSTSGFPTHDRNDATNVCHWRYPKPLPAEKGWAGSGQDPSGQGCTGVGVSGPGPCDGICSETKAAPAEIPAISTPGVIVVCSLLLSVTILTLRRSGVLRAG